MLPTYWELRTFGCTIRSSPRRTTPKRSRMRRELAEKDSANLPKQKDYMVNLAQVRLP